LLIKEAAHSLLMNTLKGERHWIEAAKTECRGSLMFKV